MGRVQRLRQEQTQARMNLIMLRWAKASMVNAYYTWKDYALIPENKVNRLVTQLDSFALQQPYPTPPTGIIHHGCAVDLWASLGGTQLVVYSGKKGLGAQEGSGHPLLLGEVQNEASFTASATETLALFDSRAAASGAAAPAGARTSKDGRLLVGGEAERSEYVPASATRKAAAEAAGGVADGAGRAANIERPVSRHKRQFGHGGQAGAAQLMQLEEDEWGQRSIATARKWVLELCKQLQTARTLADKYAYIMDDTRPVRVCLGARD